MQLERERQKKCVTQIHGRKTKPQKRKKNRCRKTVSPNYAFPACTLHTNQRITYSMGWAQQTGDCRCTINSSNAFIITVTGECEWVCVCVLAHCRIVCAVSACWRVNTVDTLARRTNMLATSTARLLWLLFRVHTANAIESGKTVVMKKGEPSSSLQWQLVSVWKTKTANVHNCNALKVFISIAWRLAMLLCEQNDNFYFVFRNVFFYSASLEWAFGHFSDSQ